MITTRTARSRQTPRRSLRLSLRALFALHRQRRDLDRLDARMLRDIGITRHQARTETRRALWDAPGHWHL